MSDDRYAQFAARYLCGAAPGMGRVHIEECAVCGTLTWRCTEERVERGHVVSSMSHQLCPCCQDVGARAPELAQWVLAVVCKALRDTDQRR